MSSIQDSTKVSFTFMKYKDANLEVLKLFEIIMINGKQKVEKRKSKRKIQIKTLMDKTITKSCNNYKIFLDICLL